MTPEQRMVESFHRLFGQTIGETPGIRDPELRIRLMREELEETCAAILAGNLEQAVDGLCDLLYVTYGSAVSFGVDLDWCFRAVHAANMQKIGGGTDEGGKIKKPPGWQPPNIRQQLRLQGWKGDNQ